MGQKNIELELRAEVNKSQYSELLRRLKKQAKFISRTKRLSVMYFGKVDDCSFDIRVRITNGQAEVVIKKGVLHAHDRIEVSQPIDKTLHSTIKCNTQIKRLLMESGNQGTCGGGY